MDAFQEVSQMVQAGGIGVALVALGLIYKLHIALVAALDKNATAYTNLAVTIARHDETIKSLEQTIEKKL